MSKLRVRPLQLSDIPKIVNYWASTSPEDLERMGADSSKIPSTSEFEQSLRRIYETHERDAKTYYLIWMVDEMAVGFSSLKNIVIGKSGEMHLHIWEPSMRGRGYGANFFCLSAVEFFRRFELEKIKCEPRASNPFPNGMLRKIGFPLVGTRVAASSELSLVCELNHYDISKSIAEGYLNTMLTSS
jgi:RimJ/RimL family protein N-acetyltransferase